MGTGALMTLTNQTTSTLTSNLSAITCMYQHGQDGSQLQEFNGMQVQPGAASAAIYIEDDGNVIGSCDLHQSHFTLDLLGQALSFDVGSGKYQTAITNATNPAIAEAILAPTMPFKNGPSYNFWVYAGPGICAALVNSALDANTAALNAALNAKPKRIDIKSGVYVVISGFQSTMTCSYAAISGMAPGRFTLTAIANGALTIDGTITALVASASIGTALKGLSAMITATVDLTQNPVAVEVTQLQLALLDRPDFSSDLIKVLIAAFSIVATADILATGPNVAGLVNALATGPIITALNTEIKDLIGTFHF